MPGMDANVTSFSLFIVIDTWGRLRGDARHPGRDTPLVPVCLGLGRASGGAVEACLFSGGTPWPRRSVRPALSACSR